MVVPISSRDHIKIVMKNFQYKKKESKVLKSAKIARVPHAAPCPCLISTHPQNHSLWLRLPHRFLWQTRAGCWSRGQLRQQSEHCKDNDWAKIYIEFLKQIASYNPWPYTENSLMYACIDSRHKFLRHSGFKDSPLRNYRQWQQRLRIWMLSNFQEPLPP